MFQIGQKVVCINDKWAINDADLALLALYNVSFPVQDKVYTIRDFRKLDGDVGLLFEELSNSRLPVVHHGRHYLDEPFFNVLSFRPLVEQKTDISIFQKIDDDVFKAPAPVRAVRAWFYLERG